MQKLNMVDADTLLYQPLDKPRFVVDGLIPTGLILFCGSQKIGKSWLMLKLCLCVSAGLPFWEMETRAGDVLYLCLEDTFFRIQDRLFRLTDEADSRLHFAVASCKLTDGLIVQLEDYLKEYPDSRLIVIDTLQKVRTASKDNAYASDYGDISQIKEFADRHSLAVIVVHHIRKQNSCQNKSCRLPDRRRHSICGRFQHRLQQIQKHHPSDSKTNAGIQRDSSVKIPGKPGIVPHPASVQPFHKITGGQLHNGGDQYDSAKYQKRRDRYLSQIKLFSLQTFQ